MKETDKRDKLSLLAHEGDRQERQTVSFSSHVSSSEMEEKHQVQEKFSNAPERRRPQQSVFAAGSSIQLSPQLRFCCSPCLLLLLLLLFQLPLEPFFGAIRLDPGLKQLHPHDDGDRQQQQEG